MSKKFNAVLWYTVSLFLAACDPGSPGDIPKGPTSVIDLPCAGQLRGLYRSDQGRSLQGLSGDSFVTTSAQIGCTPVENLHLEGAQLAGTVGTTPLNANDFSGALLMVRDASGSSAVVQITALQADTMDSSHETFLYTLQYVNPQTGALTNACTPDATGLSAALPLSGSWDATGAHIEDPTVITFGCTSGVLAKCLRWGYKPWQSYQGVALAPYHQACTRMARADYCGDGTSHTKDGTTIDVYDNLSLLQKTADPLLLFEAAWTPAGAYCLSRLRWPDLPLLPSDSCYGKFVTAAVANPVDPTATCLEERSDLSPSTVLLSNRSYSQPMAQ